MSDPNSLENIDPADLELAKIAKDLASDPKTRKRYLALIKEKNPGAVIPELDTETAIAAAAKPYIDKLAAMEKRQLERDVADRIKEKRGTLKAEGYSDDDITAIEKLMVDEQIPNHLTAAKFYRQTKQLETPTTTTPSFRNTLPVDHKALKEAGSIKNWARGEAERAVADLRAGRVKLNG